MPFSRGLKQELIYLVISGLAALIFLYLVRPFGFSNLNDRLLVTFGIVSIATGMLYVLAAHLLYRRYFPDRSWTIGLEIIYSLLFLLCIAIAILLFAGYQHIMTLNLKSFFLSLFYTMVIGIIPVSIRAIMLRNWRLKRELAEMHAINRHLQNNKAVSDQKIIEFPISRNESLAILNQDLLYIESSENYVNVAWIKDREIKKQLVRMTMKQVVGLINDPLIVFCHRSYIVNLRKAIRMNSQNGRSSILLNDVPGEIPVSETYKKQVRRNLIGIQP
jgi:LytTr DNA-binding domain-containing protein